MHDRGHLAGFGKKRKEQKSTEGGARMEVGKGVSDQPLKLALLTTQRAVYEKRLADALRRGNEEKARQARHHLKSTQRGLEKCLRC